MIILTEKKIQRATPAFRVTETIEKDHRKLYFKEAAGVPAIAKGVKALSTNKYMGLTRQDTIFSTLQGYGLNPYINKMRNVVCFCPTMEDGAAILQDIYQKFGCKGSVTITYNGDTKVYFSPDSPTDTAPALAYAKATGLPPPNPHRYLA